MNEENDRVRYIWRGRDIYRQRHRKEDIGRDRNSEIETENRAKTDRS